MNIKEEKRKELLKELVENLPNPIHKRLIESYISENSLQAMESELGKILTEINNAD